MHLKTRFAIYPWEILLHAIVSISHNLHQFGEEIDFWITQYELNMFVISNPDEYPKDRW